MPRKFRCFSSWGWLVPFGKYGYACWAAAAFAVYMFRPSIASWSSSGPVVIALLLALLVSWFSALLPVGVIVGSDRLTIVRFGILRTVIPLADISSIELLQRGGTGVSHQENEPANAWNVSTFLRVTHKDGRIVDIGTGSAEVPRTGSMMLGSIGDYSAYDRLGREIRDAVREAKAGAETAAEMRKELEERFARGRRPTRQWIEDLERLSGGGDGYRAPVVDADALVALAEDPAADPTARAGAMVVLRRAATDAQKTRVRIALEDADPKLREVMNATAAEEEASDDAEWKRVITRL